MRVSHQDCECDTCGFKTLNRPQNFEIKNSEIRKGEWKKKYDRISKRNRVKNDFVIVSGKKKRVESE